MRPVDRRLASYGTLAPGRSNHHELAGLRGTWRPGTVRGRLVPQGWGETSGYPTLILDSSGPAVPVALFESDDLATAWERLDLFEGDGYRRVRTRVDTDRGGIEAWIYVAADESGAPSPGVMPGERPPAP